MLGSGWMTKEPVVTYGKRCIACNDSIIDPGVIHYKNKENTFNPPYIREKRLLFFVYPLFALYPLKLALNPPFCYNKEIYVLA